jgi:hypothetical protein
MDYKLKYFKYKNKYKELKNKIGGVRINDLQNKYSKFKSYCDTKSYIQHTSECWSDSILTILSFSDIIKKTIQGKLYNLLVDEILELFNRQNRAILLPDYFFSTKRLSDALTKYIYYLKERFIRYYNKKGN